MKKPYTVLPTRYKSRRGDYQMTKLTEPSNLTNSTLSWYPVRLYPEEKRDHGVITEIIFAATNILAHHPYWKDEPQDFIDEYTKFYNEAFGLKWLKNPEDRHNIVVNPICCLTLIQYHNGTLHAYSRSTDMKNGYYSDKRVLDYLAQTINEKRPDCTVDKIVWYMAIPHVYVKKGIARLNTKEEEHNE